MKLQIISDLHCESYKDRGKALIESIPVCAPTLVVAGDLADFYSIQYAIPALHGKWEKVIYVTGNHEYGGVLKEQFDGIVKLQNYPRFHWLDNSALESQGHGQPNFFGGAMWYPQDPYADLTKQYMWEFQHVPDINEWVWDSHKQFVTNFDTYVNEDSVVISHNLPHQKSVHPKYKSSLLNHFFLHEMGEKILDKRPRLWIHGHTHESCDYYLGSTRIVCNPSGYSFMRNPNFNPSFVVEV